MVRSPGARHVQELPFLIVDFLKVRFVGNLSDAFLQRDYLIVTSNYGDRAELQPLRQAHYPDEYLQL
jgi:hypothetical protein